MDVAFSDTVQAELVRSAGTIPSVVFQAPEVNPCNTDPA